MPKNRSRGRPRPGRLFVHPGQHPLGIPSTDSQTPWGRGCRMHPDQHHADPNPKGTPKHRRATFAKVGTTDEAAQTTNSRCQERRPKLSTATAVETPTTQTKEGDTVELHVRNVPRSVWLKARQSA